MTRAQSSTSQAFGAAPIAATAAPAPAPAAAAAAAAAASAASASVFGSRPARKLTGTSSLAANTAVQEQGWRAATFGPGISNAPVTLPKITVPTFNPLVATSAAAFTESFYRSAMNSFLNFRLSGVKTPLLPQMHVQIPIRIMYINGFKQMRAYVDRNVDLSHLSGSSLFGAKLALACAPGVAMTPIVSVLEACNATTSSIPLYRRWMCGILPRGVREIIFGIGINQMSDHFAGLAKPLTDSRALQTAAGSIIAGVVSGYLSHVPHNLSTFKLLYPRESYSQLLQRLVNSAQESLPRRSPRALAIAKAFLAPKGVHIRTAQVVGSFVILNGIIHLLSNPHHEPAYPALEDNNSTTTRA
eukprot:m.66818 g.66818  ORF g.66818 m.66818 type:complete len:358 (-) comp7642_c0_seq1:518-1591(-)